MSLPFDIFIHDTYLTVSWPVAVGAGCAVLLFVMGLLWSFRRKPQNRGDTHDRP
jgi:hypothetical protein